MTTINPQVSDDALRSSQRRRAVLASIVGTTIEWYDFFLYSTAAALIFPKLFFPGGDPYIGLILAFGTQFGGFAARPTARRSSATTATGSAARRRWSPRC